MKWLALFLVACVPTIEPELPIPETEPPISEPPDVIAPELVEIPSLVPINTPFVIKHCGFLFEDQVRIIFDEKWPAGGMMGWSQGGCKKQTILGLNRAGERVVQFELDGKLLPEKFNIKVID